MSLVINYGLLMFSTQNISRQHYHLGTKGTHPGGRDDFRILCIVHTVHCILHIVHVYCILYIVHIYCILYITYFVYRAKSPRYKEDTSWWQGR